MSPPTIYDPGDPAGGEIYTPSAVGVREQILQNIITVLNTTRPTDVPEITRVRTLSADTSGFPLVYMVPVSDPKPERESWESCSLYLHRLLVRFEVFAKGTAAVTGPPAVPAVSPETNADPILKWLRWVLVDCTFSGLAHKADLADTTFEFDQSDIPTVKVTVDYEIEYHTLATNSTALS